MGRMVAAWLLLASPAPAQTTGLVPLTDLGAGSYEGFQGGLYPGGANHPPVTHFRAAMEAAGHIVPRDAAGAPDPAGWIGMIAVGMSNTAHEFGAFERSADLDRNRNARVVVLDTALGGQTAAILADPTAAYWTTLAQRLSAAGMTAAQVQVAWLKEADGHPPDDFPGHALVLREELEAVVDNLHARFPNLKLCYLSSRIYGGYAAPGSLNPEPQAYESGFAVKWLIEDQIAGDPGLAHDPVLLWGPYLWADGTSPRSDGLTWQLFDLEGDRTHPSAAGEEKVAALLAAFFGSEATAVPWWRARADVGLHVLDAVKDAHVSAASPAVNFGAATSLLEQGGTEPLVPYLGFEAAGVPRPAARAKLSLRVLSAGGGRVSPAPDTSWGEGAITYANAPAPGAPIVNHPQASRDGTFAADVTASVNADADGALTYVLQTPSTALASYLSREAGAAPRLVLAVPCATAGDEDGDGAGDPCDCAPQDGGAFAPPAEVAGLRWLDGGTLAWESQGSAAGAGTTYDLVSGTLASLPGGDPGDLCLGMELSVNAAADASPLPAPGEGRFFLVRAGNACGTGRWQTASDGSDRESAACP